MGFNWKVVGNRVDMKKKGIVFFIFGAVSASIVIASVFAIFSRICDGLGLSSVLGVVSTIMSILLSAVAMLYTFVSGRNTLKQIGKIDTQIEKIDTQNKRLIDKINQDLLEGAYNEAGIEAALERKPLQCRKKRGAGTKET